MFAFSKMNGLGNSFILMNDLGGEISGVVNIFELARSVCDIHFGIGADGLVLLQESKEFDFRMVIINDDGSEAEMCGNGIRCLARYVLEEQISQKKELTFETLAGPIQTALASDGAVQVNMGRPQFRNEDVVGASDGPLARVSVDDALYTFVSMGNPHAVRFVDSHEFDWRQTGARVEVARDVFPNRTNVEFCKVESPSELTMTVWERGCGETLACGTGACAMVVAAVHENKAIPGDVLVHLPGGDLNITYHPGEAVLMTGGAETVCRGMYVYTDNRKSGLSV